MSKMSATAYRSQKIREAFEHLVTEGVRLLNGKVETEVKLKLTALSTQLQKVAQNTKVICSVDFSAYEDFVGHVEAHIDRGVFVVDDDLLKDIKPLVKVFVPMKTDKVDAFINQMFKINAADEIEKIRAKGELDETGGGEDDKKESDPSTAMLAHLVYQRSFETYNTITEEEWLDLKMDIDYEKFNRLKLLAKVAALEITGKQLCFLAATIAYRGPSKASKLKIKCCAGMTLSEIGLTIVKNPNADDLTPSRFLSLFPAHAAMGLMKMGAAKRIPDSKVPAHFQFVAAASLPLPPDMAVEHRLFAESFSSLIKGKYNSDIYNSISSNKVDVPDDILAKLGLM